MKIDGEVPTFQSYVLLPSSGCTLTGGGRFLRHPCTHLYYIDHILEGSDHNKICPLRHEQFSNHKRFRNGLKFIDQNLNNVHVWTSGATKAAAPYNKVQA